MHDFRWPALITLGVLVLLFVLAGNVGRLRGKYKIDAPRTTGEPEFERAFRAHMNTVENAVLVLPALWLFAAFVSEVWAAALGAVWLAARVWYALVYLKDPAKRGPPFGLAMFAVGVLALGAAAGVVKGFL
jgi:glutathione S-transferase